MFIKINFKLNLKTFYFWSFFVVLLQKKLIKKRKAIKKEITNRKNVWPNKQLAFIISF